MVYKISLLLLLASFGILNVSGHSFTHKPPTTETPESSGSEVTDQPLPTRPLGGTDCDKLVDTCSISPVKNKAADGTLHGAPLGVSDGYISSSQITVSSSFNAGYDQNGVRLLRTVSPNGGWAAATKDMNQWVQIHLQKVTTVTGVATQGRNSARKEWVTTYKISYSPNGQAWTVYQEDKEDKVFSGNSDQNGVVKNDFKNPFQAQYVRLNPLTWIGYLSLRLEFYGYRNVCTSGLGMVSGALDSPRLAATSVFNALHDERGSRLLTTRNGGHPWAALTNDIHQYLQIDVGFDTTISAVATQGSNADNEWVKEYLLIYSTDGTAWSTYKEDGKIKIFAGNTDTRAVVTHRLSTSITARYVRFNPQSWQGHSSFRAELYGCPQEGDFPLGMTTGEIDSYHVTASSNYARSYGPSMARLLTDTPIGAWVALYNDGYQWIQVDFGKLRKVTGVATQGRLHANQWVTSYYVSYSNDGNGWTLYHEPGKMSPELFLGNSNRDGVVKHTFHPAIIAKFARILPQTYFTRTSLRFEFYGWRI